MTCQTYPPSSSNFKSNALLLERYFPKLAVHNGRSSHSTDRMCLSMLRPMHTQSCGRETPCGKSPCRPGPQSRFSAELRTTLTIFPFLQKYVRQRRHLTWSTRSAAASTAAAAVGSAAVFTSGAAPGSAAGSAAGSSERISMLRRNSEFESFPTSGTNRERSPDNNQLEQSTCCHMHLLRKGKGACLLLRRHSVQLWRPPDVKNNSEECKSHSGHVEVHAQIVFTKAPS